MLPVKLIRPFRHTLWISALLVLGGCAAQMHHHKGMSAIDDGAYADGVKELELAAELSPEDVVYRQDWLNNREKASDRLFAKAQNDLTTGHNADAEQSFRTILKFDHDNARAQAGLEAVTQAARAAEDAARARDAFKHGDIPLAQQWVARALNRVPDQPEAKSVQYDIAAMQAKELITVPNLSKAYKKPINLEFRDASLKMVFEALSRTTGINFIFDHDVKSDQHTTVFLKQTTLEDAIDVILTTSQLDKKILNNTSVLIYPNNAAKTKEYQDLMVKAFYIANADVKQTATMLKTVLKVKEAYVDEKSNMIMLRENPDTLALAEKLIALQDMAEPEVMLDVEVLEITRSRMRNLGIQVTNQLTIAPLSSLASTSTGIGTGIGSTGSSSQTMSLDDLRHLNSSMLGITLPNATLNFQKVDSDVNLLANPRIRVRDKEKAKILIGDKVPVVTTTTTATGFVAENIQYIDVGIKLDVEPEIRLHDEIGLKLGLEVSSLDSTVTTSNGSQAYQIGTRNFNTVLRLNDGETQVLGGLINKTDSTNANRFPILGEIPLLGRLFSNQKDDAEKTEIVLSITPHLIRNIHRREPSEEAFWSGTEATLRVKPLQLRSIENPTVPPAVGGVKKAASAVNESVQHASAAALDHAAQGAVVIPSGGVKVQWKGPTRGKVGETMIFKLDVDSVDTLKTLPMQLAFNGAQFEVLAVKEGDFFSKSGKAIFNQVIDKKSGRISVVAGSGDAIGIKGNGSLLTVELKPLLPTPQAEISVIGMTPVGGGQTVARVNLPIVYDVEILP